MIARLTPPPRRVVLGIAVTLVGVLLDTAILLPFRSSINADTAALLLVIPVVLGVALGGFIAAPIGVAAGFAAYDYFFIPPFHTFRVARPENLVGLLVYVVVGLIVGGVVAQVQRAEAQAERRQIEAELLNRLSQSFVATSDLRVAMQAAVHLLRNILGFSTAAVVLDEGDRRVVAAVDGPGLPEPLLSRLVTRGPLDHEALPEDAGLVIPLSTQSEQIGLLVVVGGRIDGSTRRTLATFAAQTALAVERAALEDEATRSRTLEEVDRLRSALMGAVSHDLRTPLAAIKASVSDLADPNVQLSASDRAILLRTVEEETDRLTRFVSNLLDISRIEAGALKLHRAATPLSELLEAVIARSRSLLRDHPMDVDVSDDLPLTDVDYVLTEQLFANLLENAARHTPAGTPISITAKPPLDDWLDVRVTDRGPGIPEDEHDRIFELFYTPQEAGHHKGTGMGLAICKGVVEAHGGRIWVETTPGGGATFVVRLPVAAVPQASLDLRERRG